MLLLPYPAAALPPEEQDRSFLARRTMVPRLMILLRIPGLTTTLLALPSYDTTFVKVIYIAMILKTRPTSSTVLTPSPPHLLTLSSLGGPVPARTHTYKTKDPRHHPLTLIHTYNNYRPPQTQGRKLNSTCHPRNRPLPWP